LGLKAEAPEHNCFGESGVARVELRGFFPQQVGSVAALVDTL
jgi:hypothetical protein